MKTGLYLGEVPIGKVVVAVASENGIKLQEKTVIPSKGDPIEVTPDIGIDGLSKVTIEPIPDAYIDTTTNNAPYAGDMLKGTIAFANTNKIEGTLEDKNILEYSANRLSFENGNLIVSGTNTERAIVKAEADVSITVEGTNLGNATAADVLNGKTFTSENGLVIEGTGPTLANLDAIDSNVLAGKKFIGSNGIEETGTIATKTTNDLTVSGATVTIPAGYYASDTSKSVATATQATPNINVSPTGLITASATQSAGYVSSGTKDATKQLNTKSTADYTPSTRNQTIPSGTYLTGTQTIKGDSNLVAENIVSGQSIFGVAGTAPKSFFTAVAVDSEDVFSDNYTYLNVFDDIFDNNPAPDRIIITLTIGNTSGKFNIVTSGYWQKNDDNTYTSSIYVNSDSYPGGAGSETNTYVTGTSRGSCLRIWLGNYICSIDTAYYVMCMWG